jgi:hypothetical protein
MLQSNKTKPMSNKLSSKVFYTLFFTFILFLRSDLSYAQSNGQSQTNPIAISLLMPPPSQELDERAVQYLQTKLNQLITGAGFSAMGNNHSFVMVPYLTLIDDNFVETGMSKIYQMKMEVTLLVKQTENNVLFSSFNSTQSGSGETRTAALINAMGKLQNQSTITVVKEFLTEANTKILNYYSSACEDIMNKADVYISTKEYDQAIGLLSTVPISVKSCYAQAKYNINIAFSLYQDMKCGQLLQQAKALIAQKSYSEGLKILGEISPTSTCGNNANALIESTAKLIGDKEKEEWDRYNQERKDAIEIEKLKIDAIKSIAEAYYKSQIKKINYTVIVR